MSDAIDATGAEVLAFDCPRCASTVEERLWGPCSSCRQELRASLGGAGHDVDTAGYEPKMNVTPNAVALKE